MTFVSAVLPTYNNLEQLLRCIASLQRQTRPPDQILVCIDGSTDGTTERLHLLSSGSPVQLRALAHPGKVRRGRAATRNLALRAIREGFVWYVDSDMILSSEAMKQHLQLAEREGGVSVGAVEYVNADRSIWAAYLNTRGRHRRADGEILPFSQFTTANSLVRAEHVRELGGFDERFSGYGGEDLEFAYRLQRLSRESFFNNKRAVASTVEEKTLQQALIQLESYGAKNLRLMEHLHPEMPRTFELERLLSRKGRDRLFVASLNPLTDAASDMIVRFGPPALRNHALNYRVIRAVWRGYRASESAT